MEKRLILKNGKIFTSNKEQPWADTVVINDGIFEYVGTAADMELAAENVDRVIDLQGKTLIPGLIDAHTHIGLSVMMGEDDDSIPMWSCSSKQEILDTLKAYVKKHPFRLYYAAFFGQVEAMGTEGLRKEEIDKIVKYRPVILLDKECHSAWLNSTALRLLKINESTPDMAPGYSFYERDENGKLTGCIKEMTMLPILGMTGNVSDKKMEAGIMKIINYLVDHAVTAIYDAGNYLNEEKTYKLLSKMDKEGKLPIKYEATYIITSPDKVPRAIETFKRYRSLYETEHIKFKTLKIMFDGTHRIHTAKLTEPYNNKAVTGGTMIPEDELYRLMYQLNEEKIDFHAHTVGEGASKMILDCAERIIREKGKLDIMITTAHLESQRDEDISRFAKLDVVANFTPHWHGGNDYGTMEETEELLGKKRAHNLMRANSMIKSGAIVTFSSDEVTLQLLDRWNPFLGIEIGHTRQEVTAGGEKAPVFPPKEECLAVEDLIEGYTINAAYALRLDDKLGSIEKGKEAAFAVLNKDIFTIDPYEIHTIEPEVVMIEGKVVKGTLAIRR